MTLEEAQKIASVIAECPEASASCLAQAMSEEFPEFLWTVDDNYYDAPASEGVSVTEVKP